jgi:hypothetical protein
MRLCNFETTFVTYVPRDLDNGHLYVSMEYSTAVHLCACGCSTKTVTPLARDGWTLKFDGTVTLRPSVGNGQSPCRANYLITGNAVEWLPTIGTAATREALTRDRQAAAAAHAARRPRVWWSRLTEALRRRLRSGGSDG